jgi:hypothetical protein
LRYAVVREVNEELAERMEKARTLREFTRLLAVYNVLQNKLRAKL